MTDWPDDLPCPPIDSWNAVPTPRTAAFETDSGIPRHRQVNDRAWWLLSFDLHLSPDQRTILDEFCEDLSTAVDEGFLFKRPDTGATVPCRFTAEGWPRYRGLGLTQIASIVLIAEPE